MYLFGVYSIVFWWAIQTVCSQLVLTSGSKLGKIHNQAFVNPYNKTEYELLKWVNRYIFQDRKNVEEFVTDIMSSRKVTIRLQERSTL